MYCSWDSCAWLVRMQCEQCVHALWCNITAAHILLVHVRLFSTDAIACTCCCVLLVLQVLMSNIGELPEAMHSHHGGLGYAWQRPLNAVSAGLQLSRLFSSPCVLFCAIF
jgi:hypothetical protein